MSLSHGQATVERGFSINANLIVENLQEESIAAQRIVHDSISHAGGVLEVPLVRELLRSVKGSHQKYLAALDTKRTQNERTVKQKEMKDELQDLTKQKKLCESEVCDLTHSADELSEKAESAHSLSKITESNALRKRAREKQDKLKLLNEEIESKKRKMKLL